MKTFPILFALICTATPLLADAPPPPPAATVIYEPPGSQPLPKPDASATVQIAFDLAVFAVPQEKAAGLLGDLHDPAKVGDVQRELEAMAGKKEATLVAWPHLTTTPGQRAQTETTDELRYPTEFDPGTGPAENDNAEAVSGVEITPKLVGKRVTPTAFETRDCGPHFEVLPTLSPDGERVVAAVNFSWPQLRGWHTYVGQFWQPNFLVPRSSGCFVLRNGVPNILGVYRINSNQFAIVILRGTIEKPR